MGPSWSVVASEGSPNWFIPIRQLNFAFETLFIIIQFPECDGQTYEIMVQLRFKFVSWIWTDWNGNPSRPDNRVHHWWAQVPRERSCGSLVIHLVDLHNILRLKCNLMKMHRLRRLNKNTAYSSVHWKPLILPFQFTTWNSPSGCVGRFGQLPE